MFSASIVVCFVGVVVVVVVVVVVFFAVGVAVVVVVVVVAPTNTSHNARMGPTRVTATKDIIMFF